MGSAVESVLRQIHPEYLTDYELVELINDVAPGKPGSLPYPVRQDELDEALNELTKVKHIVKIPKGDTWKYKIALANLGWRK
jgi:hypothetical protein